MTCPSCNYSRQEADRIIPDWQCPRCGVAYAKVVAAIGRLAKVRFVSGHELHFNRVKLYDLALVMQLERLRQLAAKNLSGPSTGLGFSGSLEWVAVGTLIAGAIENSVSNQMARDAAAQLQDINDLRKRIRDSATFIHVSSIENIKYPEVGLWRATLNEKAARREMIHVATDYVFVEVNGKETAIFWDKVEQYELVENSLVQT